MEVFEKCNEMFENCSSCARELYIEAILSERTSEAILKEFREFIVDLSERNKNSDLEDIFTDVLDAFDCSCIDAAQATALAHVTLGEWDQHKKHNLAKLVLPIGKLKQRSKGKKQ
jgi:hypothetical protein